MQEIIGVEDSIDAARSLASLLLKVRDLPPLPAIALRVLEVTSDPETCPADLQSVISMDQGLTSKVLKIVNSAMYSLRHGVSTVSHAVAVLGVEAVRGIAMAASVEKVFQNCSVSGTDLGTKLLSDHSWGAAIAARTIAKHVRYENSEEAMIAGLMHDIGKPVLIQNYGDRYTEILSDVYRGGTTFHEAELQAFGFSHAQAGALLAQKWNFPHQLSESIQYHHSPLSAPKNKILACIVSLSNMMMIVQGVGFEKNEELNLSEQPAAQVLGLSSSAIESLFAEVSLNHSDALTALRS